MQYQLLLKLIYWRLEMLAIKLSDVAFTILKNVEMQTVVGPVRIKYHTWPRIPHGKETKTQPNTTKESQGVSPFPAIDHKVAMSKHESMTNTKKK